MNACKGLVGRLLGHKFDARYSIGAADLPLSLIDLKGPSSQVQEALEKMRPWTYHGDVCERCGLVVESPFKEPK